MDATETTPITVPGTAALEPEGIRGEGGRGFILIVHSMCETIVRVKI